MAASKAVFDEVEQRIQGTFRPPTTEPSGLTRQRQFLAGQLVQQRPCWACGRPSSQLEAGGEDYTLGRGSSSYTCPYCTAPMLCVTPFVSVDGVAWNWKRPSNVRATGWAEVPSGEVER